MECPYCGVENTVDYGDIYGEGQYEFDCVMCKKTFVGYLSYLPCWDPKKADCLNGGDHDWGKGMSVGRVVEKYDECKVCGEKRNIVTEEIGAEI
jgi:hypothetical protein